MCMRTRSSAHPFRSEKARQAYLAHYDRRACEWPASTHGLTVETADGQTHIRIGGPAGAPPLVLLPGINASSLMWQPNFTGLAQNYRVHAVDTIGDFGRSVAKRPMQTADNLVDWLDELFTALGLGNDINLIGISYGGWIAGQYARRHPARLRNLVLLAPACTVLPLRLAFMLRAMPCIIPHRWFTERFLHWMAADAAANGGASRRAVEAMIDHAYLGLQSFKLRRPVIPTILTDEQLRNLAVPTLYMVGENEKLYSAGAAVRRLHRVAPGITTEVVSNAGHDLTTAQAEHVNQKILAFLERSLNPSPAIDERVA
jgi:pimeloyl-ACP methyl ester carboxylesterase